MSQPPLLYVVRHGETEWNRDRRIQGQQDSPLNDTGLEQAQDVAERLLSELGQAGGALPLWSSDLLRALQTAIAIGQVLDCRAARKSRRLRERMFGAVEGHTWAELTEEYPDEVKAYKSGEDRDAIPGIEPYARFRERVLRSFRVISRRGESALVVTHGGVMRVLLEEALGEDKRFMISNTALYRFRIHEDRVERVLK